MQKLLLTCVLAAMLVVPAVSAEGAVYATGSNRSGQTGDVSYSASADLPAAGKAYAGFGQGATTYRTNFDYVVKGDLAPGVLEAKPVISCDVPTVFRPGTTTDVRRATMQVILYKGTSEISSALIDSTRTCDGPSDVWAPTFSLDSTSATFVAGELLRLQFLVWVVNPPPGTAAENVYFQVGGTAPTGIFGPGLPGDAAAIEPPETAIETITGTTQGNVSHSFSEPTSVSYRLNYSASAMENLSYEPMISAGSVEVNITGPNGVVFVSGDEASNQTISDAGGNWTIAIDYVDFTGIVNLTLSPVATGEPGAGPTEGNPGDPGEEGGAQSGNQTAAPEKADDEDAPIPAYLVLVAVAVAVFRRKQ